MTFVDNKISPVPSSLIRYRLLVVDDDVMNRTLLEALLRSQPDYDVAAVTDAERALAFLDKGQVDLVLIDTMLPDADGYALCRQIQESLNRANLPIILFSRSATGAERAKALSAGAADIIVKPFQRTELMLRLRNILRLKSLQDQLNEVEHAMLTMSSLIEARDNYTHGHAQRVAANIALLGQAAGLGEEEIHLLRRAAFLKDIGKSGIPDAHLNESGNWSSEKREELTERMIIPWQATKFEVGTPRLFPIVRHCHENYDGSGYPDQLAGDQIPLGARLLSIVDSYDALISNRPFRPALSPFAAQSILEAGSGTQWDPHFVELFIACLQQADFRKTTLQDITLLAA